MGRSAADVSVDNAQIGLRPAIPRPNRRWSSRGLVFAQFETGDLVATHVVGSSAVASNMFAAGTRTLSKSTARGSPDTSLQRSAWCHPLNASFTREQFGNGIDKA